VPPEWYDADYFERGVKSNWEHGYEWSSFSGLFRDTAAFLAETFADTRTFLDVGCARGFLVRTLREQGRECWGVDHSHWAIAHADELARPFLVQAGVDDYRSERAVDVTLAFDLLPSLTERQAADFLAAARGWTGTAIVAVIASFESEAEERGWREAGDDRDLSHVLMRTRAWWHEQFLRAGWRQDPLQAVAARVCQRHPLPRRMGWKMYVYAPR
jgi:hypothetical protein